MIPGILGVWACNGKGQPQPTPAAEAGALASASAGPDAAPPALTRKPFAKPGDEQPNTVQAQHERLFKRMRDELQLTSAQVDKVRSIFKADRLISQGNPATTIHPMTRGECWQARQDAGLNSGKALEVLAEREQKCKAPFMSPIGPSPTGKGTLCIDQFEYPNIPCEYPVVFVSALEATQLCKAVGKRICDAHEWEGACAGKVLPVDDEYEWDRPTRIAMEYFHNLDREKVWSYGPEKNHKLCATNSRKSKKCNGGGWETCGSNTYPAGSFPTCVSSFGVYDINGNAAEHMNLPVKPDQLASRGGLGVTEMKGSWFAFQRDEAHEDDCRWRAPAWHTSMVSDLNSHLNYHLGFRCCKDVD
jgi:hypothetical protein